MTNGYADPIWSLAAVGAVAYGLQLRMSRANQGVTLILVLVAGMSKHEGLRHRHRLLIALIAFRGLVTMADEDRHRHWWRPIRHRPGRTGRHRRLACGHADHSRPGRCPCRTRRFMTCPGRARTAFDGMSALPPRGRPGRTAGRGGRCVPLRGEAQERSSQRPVGVGRSGRRTRAPSPRADITGTSPRAGAGLVGTVDRVTEFPALTGWWIVAMWALTASGVPLAVRRPSPRTSRNARSGDRDRGRTFPLNEPADELPWPQSEPSRSSAQGSDVISVEPDAAATPEGGHEGPAHAKMPAPAVLRWWPVVVPVVIVLVGAWSYRWVDEDAFTYFPIIDNLLAGHGLVFNLGERVEVNSDPLWLFTLTALPRDIAFYSDRVALVFLGLACTGTGFWAGGRAIQRLAALGGMSRPCSPSVCWWSRWWPAYGSSPPLGLRCRWSFVAGCLISLPGEGRGPPEPSGAGGPRHGTRPAPSGRSWPWPP